MKKMKRMLGLAAALALSLCANRVEAGLANGGELTAASAGMVLQHGFFYNLSSDQTLTGYVTGDNLNGSGLLLPANWTAAINLNGHTLTVVGQAGEGERGGGAGIQLGNGAKLYVCGNGGTLKATGGKAANGVNGGDGGSADGIERGAESKKNTDQPVHSGAGGVGGAGGGGGGAGIGDAGAAGGSAAGGGGAYVVIHAGEDEHANGNRGANGANGDTSAINFTFVRVSTLKACTLTGGAASAQGGNGGNKGIDLIWKMGSFLGIADRLQEAGGGGGGGGGGAGKAGAKCGTGGGGGGQGGGGGSGGCDSSRESWTGLFDHFRVSGGYGGGGGYGAASGEIGEKADQRDIGDNGHPGEGGQGGSSGGNSVERAQASGAASTYGDLVYTVTLDAQSGEGGADKASCYLGEIPATIAIPSRTGYSFGGYYTEINGVGTCYFNGKGEGTRRWDTDVGKLYAKWTIATSVVKFDAHGGTGAGGNITLTYGAALPTVAVPELTGHAFLGYFDAATGGTKYYNADGTGARNWDKVSDTTLHAQWKANVYTITLPDGTKVSATYGQKAANVTPAEKTGYAFNGYAGTDGTLYYKADGSPAAATWATPTDVTLVSLFSPKTYTIVLDARGGAGGTESVTATFDADLPPVAIPAITGYTFLGYFDAQEGGKQYYGDTGKSMVAWTIDSGATLYAQWKIRTFTITLDAQGGTDGDPVALVEYLAALPDITVPARAGHTFLGYFGATTEGAPKYYEPDGTSTNSYEWTENQTFYAQWKVNTYKYVLDGGTFTGELAVVYGTLPQDVEYVPEEEHRVFTGYFDKDGNMVFDKDGKYVGVTGYLAAEDTRLTAVWKWKPEELAMVGEPRTRWPWNGKYDITYTAKHLQPDCRYIVSVELMVTEPGAEEPVARPRFVAIPSEDGEHELTADFAGVVAPETLDANATVRLRLYLSEED